MLKVSVIVPIYNQKEEYLRECLDSILSQTLKDIEVLCINDGSTNNSREIIDEYRCRDERVKLLEHENGENKGLSASRNLGIKYAQGEFISFVDSDDFIENNFLEILYNLANNNNVDIAASSIYKYKETKSLTNEDIFFDYKDNLKVARSSKDKFKISGVPKYCYVWNKLYRKDKLLKTKVLFENDRLFEDIEWSHKIIYYLNGLAVTNDTHYYYRINEESIVFTRSDKWIKDMYISNKKSIDFMQSIPTDVGNMRDYDWSTMKTYKLFNKTIMYIRTCGLYKLYYLFGKWLIFEIHEKRNTHG